MRSALVVAVVGCVVSLFSSCTTKTTHPNDLVLHDNDIQLPFLHSLLQDTPATPLGRPWLGALLHRRRLSSSSVSVVVVVVVVVCRRVVRRTQEGIDHQAET